MKINELISKEPSQPSRLSSHDINIAGLQFQHLTLINLSFMFIQLIIIHSAVNTLTKQEHILHIKTLNWVSRQCAQSYANTQPLPVLEVAPGGSHVSEFTH